MSRKLPVFLTVDLEIWPFKRGWPRQTRLKPEEKDLTPQFRFCILGETAHGELGLRYQLKMLDQYGLRATFFIEALHAAAVGSRWLDETVGIVLGTSHEIQMHAHTEWLTDASDPGLPQRHEQCLWGLSLPEQIRVLTWVKRRLEDSGVKDLCAFRAGNFGANLDTLKALHTIGIPVDSSYNPAYLGGQCRIETGPGIYRHTMVDRTEEIPVTALRGLLGRPRAMHLAALSSLEIERALWQAYDRGWESFVIVWHGSELLRPVFEPGSKALQSSIVVRRFQRLCSFLAEHRDRFQTLLFSERTPPAELPSGPRVPLTSTPRLAIHRLVEQIAGRFV